MFFNQLGIIFDNPGQYKLGSNSDQICVAQVMADGGVLLFSSIFSFYLQLLAGILIFKYLDL